MPGTDPEHWLYRLTTDEWLAAARNELARAAEALRQKQQRAGLAQARRAAGMAWNAVLVLTPDEKYGRSYMEHLQALRADAGVSDDVRAAATALCDAPLEAKLVQLGPGSVALASHAETILQYATTTVEARRKVS